MVVVLRSTAASRWLLAALRDGLADAGYVDGRNVTVVHRSADSDPARLQGLARELGQGGASLIVGNSEAAAAAAGVAAVPFVLVTADDPVQRGAGVPRFALVRELVPGAKVVAFLLDARVPGGDEELTEVETAARAGGVTIAAFRVHGVGDLASVFDAFVKAGARAVIVGGSPVFAEQRYRIAPLALDRRLAAVSDQREFVVAGGLASHAPSVTDAYRQAGIAAGKVLSGGKPSDLPRAHFELAINLKTAKALGLTVPPSLLSRADETVL